MTPVPSVCTAHNRVLLDNEWVVVKYSVILSIIRFPHYENYCSECLREMQTVLDNLNKVKYKKGKPDEQNG